jgi:hypothetical protein
LKDVDNSAKYTAAIIMDEEEAKGAVLTSRKHQQASSTKHQAELFFIFDCARLLCSVVSI